MDIEVEAEYEVEEILEERYFKGKPHYLLKWRGYSKNQSTWEPIENMEHALPYLIAWKKQKIMGDCKTKMISKEGVFHGNSKRQSTEEFEPKRKVTNKMRKAPLFRKTQKEDVPWAALKGTTDKDSTSIQQPEIEKLRIESYESANVKMCGNTFVIELEEVSEIDRKTEGQVGPKPESKKSSNCTSIKIHPQIFDHLSSNLQPPSEIPGNPKVEMVSRLQYETHQGQSPMIDISERPGNEQFPLSHPTFLNQEMSNISSKPKEMTETNLEIPKQSEQNQQKSNYSQAQQNSVSNQSNPVRQVNRTAPIWSENLLEQQGEDGHNSSYFSQSTRPYTNSQPFRRRLPQLPEDLSLARSDREMIQSEFETQSIPKLEETPEGDVQGPGKDYSESIFEKVITLDEASIIKVDGVILSEGKRYLQLQLRNGSIGLIGHKRMKTMHPHILCSFYEELLKGDPRAFPDLSILENSEMKND